MDELTFLKKQVSELNDENLQLRSEGGLLKRQNRSIRVVFKKATVH